MRKKPLRKILFAVVGLSILGFFGFSPRTALAANPATISFQGKVVSNVSGSVGTNVTDGTYSVVFRIYNTASPTMTTSCTSTASCLWEETQGSVTVTNSIFQVELGASCALTSASCNNSTGGPINYASTSSLYLTMQFNGDTSGSNGGFMSPLIHLNSVPFALYSDNSAALSGLTAGNFVQLAQGLQTDGSTTNASIAINKTGSTANILTLQKSGASVLTIANAGATIFKNQTDSTAAFQVQTSGSSTILAVDATNSRVGVDVTYSSMTVPTQNTPSTSTSGGTLAATTYYYKISAIDSAGGETGPNNNEQSQVTTGSTSTVTLSWVTVTGASGYKIYRGTTALGGSNSEVYLVTTLGTVNGANLNYTDTGAISAGTATPPSTNSAYISTNNSSSQLQLSVGGVGTPTGQVYISGVVPTDPIGTTNNASDTSGDVSVQGRYAYYVSYANNALVIIDVSNPASPTQVGSITTGLNHPRNLFVQGSYAYVSSETNNTFAIFDVSNPASPTAVSTTTAGLSNPRGIYVQGRYAYVGTLSSGLAIFDVGNPANPIRLGSIPNSSCDPRNLFVKGNYAYMACNSLNKLAIADISNPASPTIVGSSPTTGLSGLFDVYIQGRYAYLVSQSNATFAIFDVSNPASPTKIASTTSSLSFPTSVSVQGRYAYITSQNNNKLVVFDVSNPTTPINIGATSSNNLSLPYMVYIQGRYVYVTNQGGPNALSIYDFGGLYTQQLEAGSIETGTLEVSSNGQVAGNFDIQGGLGVGGGIQVSGDLGLSGGAFIQGGTIIAGGANLLGAPGGSVTVTPTCVSSCTFTYSYVVTALNAYGGESTVSNTGTTSVGRNPALNSVSWSAVSGSSGYKVYRTSANGTGNSATTGYIGTTTSTSLSDAAIAGDSSVAPATDTTGQLTVLGSALIKSSSNSTSAFQVQTASSVALLAIDTQNTTINVGVTGTTATASIVNIANSTGAVSQTVSIGSLQSTSTTTIQSGSGNINLSPSAGNDVVFSQGAGSQLKLTASAATTLDQLAITNASGATSTTGVNGASVNFNTTGSTASADNSGMRIDVTSNDSGATTTLQGLKIGDLASAEANSTETGVYVGTGWDIGLDLESGGLQLKAQTDPAAPASGLIRLYAKSVAGRVVIKTIGSAGIDTPLQNALWQNNTVIWTPSTANGVWQGATGGSIGTNAIQQPTTTNLYTSERRTTNVAATAAANIQNGIRSDAQFFHGNAAGNGGFFMVVHFGTETWTAGDRLFVGMGTCTTACTTVNPSTLVNIAGFGIDAGDTAITFMHNDGSGTATKDTIAGQPTLASSQGYDAYIYMKPNDSTIYYRLDDTNAATTIIDTSTATDIIAANTMVVASAVMGTGTNTVAANSKIGINRIYIETDH